MKRIYGTIQLTFLSWIALIIHHQTRACPFHKKWRGSFVEYVRRSANENVLAARIGSYLGRGLAVSFFPATIDLVSGRVYPGLPRSFIYARLKPSKSDIIYELDVIDGYATLTGSNGFSTTLKLQVSNQHTKDGSVETNFFVSPKLQRAYVFYDEGQGSSMSKVAIVNLADETVQHRPYGYDYVVGEEESIPYNDDIQVAMLPGKYSDCISSINVFYNESDVVVRWQDRVESWGDAPHLEGGTFCDAVVRSAHLSLDTCYAHTVHNVVRFTKEGVGVADGHVVSKVNIETGEKIDSFLNWHDIQSFTPQCIQERKRCTQAGQCCDELVCYSNRCLFCHLEQGACFQDDDCCGDLVCGAEGMCKSTDVRLQAKKCSKKKCKKRPCCTGWKCNNKGKCKKRKM